MFTALKNKAVDLVSKRKRATYILVAFLILFGGVLLLIEPVSAGWIAKTVSGAMEVWNAVIGGLILLLFNALVGWIAPYNEFIRSAAVSTGWVLTRDIANMFFILVLLAIAFGTILKIEQLNYQKILPKLLIMAVLINFSKTICGVVIDFAQVIMLTFVNAFMAAAGGNFLNAMGIYRMMQINELSDKAIDDLELAKAFIFAGLFMLVALLVVVVYVMVLAYRIVILWILIIMAPIAWLAGAFPIGKASQVYSEWWDNFVGAVVVGPILAFFLWLALLTAGGGTLGQTFENPAYTASQSEQAAIGQNFFLNEAATTESTVGFIIATALLLAGLAAAQQSGGVAGAFAGKTASKTRGFAGSAIKGAAIGAGALTWKAAKGTAGYADRQGRLRERAYGALGRVPGLKQFSMANLAKARKERLDRTSDVSKVAASLRGKELENVVGGRAITREQRDLRLMAKKQAVGKDYAKYLADEKDMTPSQIKAYQARTLSEIKDEADKGDDIETLKWANEYYEKRPDLIEGKDAKKAAFKKMGGAEMGNVALSAFQDTAILEAAAELEMANKGSVSGVLKGQQKALLEKYMQQYPTGKAPGEGTFSLAKGYEPAEIDRAAKFKEMAHDTQVQTMIRNRNNVITQAPEPDAVKVGSGDQRMYNPEVATYMKKAHQLGSKEAYNVDPRSGNFNKEGIVDQTAAQNTFASALADAVRDIKSDTVTAEIKTDAANFISNIDVDALQVEGGNFGKEVLKKVDDQSLAQAYQTAEPEEKIKVEKVIQGVSKELKKQMKKLAPNSEEYAEKFAKYQKMRMNPNIRKHVS